MSLYLFLNVDGHISDHIKIYYGRDKFSLYKNKTSVGTYLKMIKNQMKTENKTQFVIFIY